MATLAVALGMRASTMLPRDDEAEGLALEGGLELAEDEEDYALEQSGLAKSRADGEHRDDSSR